MDRSISLIKIFIQISDFVKSYFEKNPYQSNFSPNQNYFYTEEVISVYIFGIQFGLLSVKEIHSYICEHFRDWFPKIPEYQAFNYRLNRSAEIFVEFSKQLISNAEKTTDMKELIESIDSMPIVVSKKTRKKSKIKKDAKLNNGYCSSKKLHFYGAKLHFVIVNQESSLGKPFTFEVTPAAPHDLTVAKTMTDQFKDCTLIGDKAYISQEFSDKLLKNNVKLVNPIKLSKNKKEYSENENLFNKLVSSRRQSIEIFFAWIIQKTKIQKASLIRSISGFTFFVHSRIALALMLLQKV